MIQIDSSLILQIINFVFLIFILNLLLYKPMLSVLDERKRRIDQSGEEIEALKKKVEEKTAAYEEKLRSIRSASLGKNRELVKEASDSAKAIIDEAHKEISVAMEDFYGKIRRDTQEAKGFMREQSGALSLKIAEKVLGRSLQ